MINEPSLRKIFKQREDYIIIGLTGRTGSGCTTLAEILAKTYDRLDKEAIDEPPNINNRKNKIVSVFVEKKWQPFTKIEVTSVIVLFMFDLEANLIEVLKNHYSVNVDTKLQEAYKTLKKDYQLVKDIKSINKESSILGEAYQFYFKKLPEFKEVLKKTLENQKKYTKVFQDAGDSIRISGIVFEKNGNGSHLLAISEKINDLIKIARDYNALNAKKDYFVIDAFRNPFEAFFFKQRYSSFYMISVNAPNQQRKDRLHRKQLTNLDIETIDGREFPKEKDSYASIDVKSCIEYADIHINNPDNEIHEKYFLMTNTVIRYIALMMHPGLVTPSKDERCMQIAYTAKFNSGCISRQVGAIVTDSEYSIKAVGWNDTPYGHVTCLLRNLGDLVQGNDKGAFSMYELNDKKFREVAEDYYRRRNNVGNLDGRSFSYCFKTIINKCENQKNQVHTRSLHAEENAFLQISKYGGQGIKDGVLFTTASPCELCSKKAYQLGIKRIVYIDLYPGISQPHILECGTLRPEMELFSGAIGRAYHQLYEPLMSFKDELTGLLDGNIKTTDNLKTDLRKIMENAWKLNNRGELPGLFRILTDLRKKNIIESDGEVDHFIHLLENQKNCGEGEYEKAISVIQERSENTACKV